MSFFHIFILAAFFIFIGVARTLPENTPPLGIFIIFFGYWFFIISIHTFYKNGEKKYEFKKPALLALGIALLTLFCNFAAQKSTAELEKLEKTEISKNPR